MALYRISEQEWEQHVKDKLYSHAKKQALADVSRMRNKLFTPGNKDGNDGKKLNKKAKKRMAQEPNVKAPELIKW
jgi:hypothetical protein